ncbi:hypothetical protein GCM10023340_31440 [Nocardioides marinquilinus]|uniref:Glycosyltransferase n=1 Tax=Nocardioides marinquilinus TaxID=1210400 RepID=A0ABP9PTU7_9ACTN
MSTGRLHVLVPFFLPFGGVIKILDYAQHARAAGLDVRLWSPAQLDPEGPLFRIERLRDLVDVDFRARYPTRGGIKRDDLFLISRPDDYEAALRSLPIGLSPLRVVHLVQNVRHRTPTWRHGYATRLLTRPVSRIAINDIVAEAISPWLDPRSPLRVVRIGHESEYFARDVDGGWPDDRPLRVAYTTWKSDVGDRAAKALDAGAGGAGARPVEWRAIRESVSWAELRELYHWADVFLGTPDPEEGMYLPGLEAMAAGCVVITPDCGGNMAYARPGENCVLVDYDDADDYARAVREVAGWSAEQVVASRTAGYEQPPRFRLDDEARGFIEVLDEVRELARAHEAGAAPSGATRAD